MLRAALWLAAFSALVAASGCTMCCHPYDYCGPVWEGDQNCCAHARANSIFEPRDADPTPRPDAIGSQSRPRVVGKAAPREAVPSKVVHSQTSRRPQPHIADANRSRTPAEASQRRTQYSAGHNPKRAPSPGLAYSRQLPNSTQYLAKHQKSSQYRGPSSADVRAQIEAETRPDDLPGSQKIVSVTERVVGPTLSAPSSPETSESEPAMVDVSTKTLPSSGWTARRPAAFETR